MNTANSYNTLTVRTDQSHDIHMKSWFRDSPKANILIIHGYAEHSGRYSEIAQHFYDQDYGVYAYDHQGHGQSSGKDCYIKSFDEWVLDLGSVIKSMNEEQPYFIYAHSVGALVTIKYHLESREFGSNFKGLITTGPALKISEDLSPTLQKMSTFLGAVVPWLKTVKLPAEGISRLPLEQKKYDDDPLIYRGGTYASTGANIIKNTKFVQAHLSNVTLPFLVMHGGDDPIIEPDSTRMLFEQAKSSDKEMVIWDDLFHEIIRSSEKVHIWKKMTDWMEHRI